MQSEYFFVEHPITVNLTPWAQPLPNEAEFELQIPLPFRLAGELQSTEASSIKGLHTLADGGEALISHLAALNRKVNLLLALVLAQQDDAQARASARSFGGSGVDVLSTEAVEIGTTYSIKVFLPEDGVGVYAIAAVQHCHALEDGYLLRLNFVRIRELDRESLIRASLRVQSQQLKKRAEQRNQRSE